MLWDDGPRGDAPSLSLTLLTEYTMGNFIRAVCSVCAWCERLMGGPRNAPHISHGICPWCADEFYRDSIHPADPVWGEWVDVGGEGGA